MEVLMPEGLPHNPYFLGDLQPTARLAAALPALGAWDALPTVITTAGMDHALIVCAYLRGAAGGAYEIAVWTSTVSSGASWARTSIYDAGAVAINTDTTSSLQAEGIEYGATSANLEAVTYGPLALNGAVERMYIAARETGVVGTPGQLSITVFLT
jgi:hypothetical protein